jgi:hypothetical protein
MRARDLINEIERLKKDDYAGGKDALYRGVLPKEVYKLPGGSGFTYSADRSMGGWKIKIWDPAGTDKPTKLGQLIGSLNLISTNNFPIKNAVQVDTITVDEDYRGRSIAKSLYGIVLSELKLTLLSGASQTPGGRRNWLSLSKIPGVEVQGWVAVSDSEIDPDRDGRSASNRIDTLMGKLGAEYLGPGSKGRIHFFAYDVRPGQTEMEPVMKTALSKLYHNGAPDWDTGLIARWQGA